MSLQTGAFVIALACAAGVQAQTSSTAPPPIDSSIDANSVDVISGALVHSAGTFFIGDGSRGGLSHTYFPTSLSARHGTPSGTVHAWDRFGVRYIVTVGNTSERFSGHDFTGFNPELNNGSTFAFDQATVRYVYTMRDGTVAVFSPASASALDANRGQLESLTYPSGERLEYRYRSISCQPGTQGCPAHVLKSVTSNVGYQMRFYASGRVVLFNMAVDYCDPAADTCPAFTQAWPEVNVTSTPTLRATDALGRSTTYAPGPNGTTVMTHPSGRSITFRYTVPPQCVSPDESQVLSGLVISMISDGVRTWNYGYSESDTCNEVTNLRTVTMTDPQGHQRIAISNPWLAGLISIRNEVNQTTGYSAAYGQLYRRTHPEGNYTNHEYDSRGNLFTTTQVPKPGSGLTDVVTSANYDAVCSNRKTCNQPNFAIDGRGARTDYTYDPTHGGVLTVTYPAPGVGAPRPQIRYSYTALYAYYKNSMGQIVAAPTPIYKLTGISQCMAGSSCVGTADEIKTTITYGTAGVANNLLPTSITEGAGDGSVSRTITTTYDAVGNPITVDGPLPGTADTVRTRYDVMRQVIGIIGPDPDGAGPLKHRAERRTYNGDGQVTFVEHGIVNSQSDGDWAAMTVLEVMAATYDSTGRKVTNTRAGTGSTQTVTQYSYDTKGRLECEVQRMNPATFGSLPATACVLGTEGSFGPDRIRRNFYDQANRVTTVQAAVGTSVQRVESTRTYTPNGHLGTVADARNYLTTYEYDGFDRLAKTRYPAPSSPGVSSSSDFEQLSYDANSNVLSKRRRSGQVIGYVPDALNRVAIKDLPTGSAEDVYFTYDHQGQVRAAGFGAPGGMGIANTFDALGRRTESTAYGRTLYYQYDPTGRPTRVTHPDGFYASYEFNTAGDLIAVRDSTNVALATYTYDALGRRLGASHGNGSSYGYGYDAIGRRNSLTMNLAGSSHDNTITLSHSPASQIVSRIQTNDAQYGWRPFAAATVSSSANGLNQLTQIGSTSVSHDPLGNLVTGAAAGASAWTYGYDVENQLRSAVLGTNSLSLNYDPTGLLREVSSNGSPIQFLYDGPSLLAEYGSTGQVLRRYVHGVRADEPLAWYEGPGTGDRRYFHADERGSIVATSNNDGTPRATINYSTYGEAVNAADSRFGFTGQAWIPSLGLYNYKARMYSPQLGRFMQTDPVGYVDDVNLYAYVRNDPLNNRDPTGKYTCEGSKANCDAVADGVRRANEILPEMPKGKDKQRLAASLKELGEPGVKNGVTFKFSDRVRFGQHWLEQDGSSTITLWDEFHVAGTGWPGAVLSDTRAAVVAHEGSHRTDALAAHRNPRGRAEHSATERPAYHMNSSMHQVMGSRSISGVWDPAWPADQMEALRAKGIEAAVQNSLIGVTD